MAKRSRSATAQLKIRTREPLRARLEAAAKRRGVSLNAEIVDRLKKSMETEDRFGGPGMVDLFETIARVMKSTGEHAGFYATGKLEDQGKWMGVPFAFDQAMVAAVAILEHHRPPGEIVEPIPRKTVVAGVRGTKVDAKKSAARGREIIANIGQLIADAELRKKGEHDE